MRTCLTRGGHAVSSVPALEQRRIYQEEIMALRHTEGATRLGGGSGGCSSGESERLLLGAESGAWCSGNEGVDALVILSWPRGHLCAADEEWPAPERCAGGKGVRRREEALD
jgi:hypothetical protein